MQQTSGNSKLKTGVRTALSSVEPTVDDMSETDSFIQTLVRRSMFWSPLYSDGEWNEYVPLAFWLVDVLRPKLVVEVGSVVPTSYYALCQAVHRLDIGSKCIAIDTVARANRSEHVDLLRSYSSQHYFAFSSVRAGSFVDESAVFDHSVIDLLHLNLLSIESTETTFSHSIENWLNRVADGGLVLISGSGASTPDIWLQQGLSKLKRDYSVFEFTHGAGLLLVWLGKECSGPLASLFRSQEFNSKNSAAIRELFARLGQGCSDAHALRKMQKEATASTEKIGELRILKEALGKTAEESVAALRAEIDGMRQEAAVMEEELLQSRKTVSEHTLKINTLGTELKQADVLRERQIQELAALTKLLLQAEEKLERVQAEFAAMASLVKDVQQVSPVRERKHGRLPGLLRVLSGGARGAKKDRGGAKYLQAQKLLLGSALFDEKWYVNQYADVSASSLSPVEHYLTVGAALGYDPSANFDSSYYLDKYQDVAASGMNPLVHYLRFGISENRKPKAN